MFTTLVGAAALIELLNQVLVQYSFMRDTKQDPEKHVTVNIPAVIEKLELDGWNDLSVDEKVQIFRRGLQRQEYKEHIENAA